MDQRCLLFSVIGIWYYPSFFLSNVLKDRLGKIEMLQWRVTPPTIVIWERVIWWAEVCSCDNYGTWETPFAIIKALDLKTSSTCETVVEESSTQCSCGCSVPLTIQISIPACSSCAKSTDWFDDA